MEEHGDASYAAEWLLDNFYIVEQALRQIREDLPPGYYRRLPKLCDSALAGYPRATLLAAELIRASGAQLSVDQVRDQVIAVQRTVPLTIGEVWALPTMLRLGLLERLSLALGSHAPLPAIAEHPFAAAVTLSPEPGIEDAVAGGIRGLRVLATADWQVFFEDVSVVERLLRQDPAAVYGRMDFETRDRYRQAVEELALVAAGDEAAVAQHAVALARESASAGTAGSETARSHVGFFLVGDGRADLEARLKYRPSWDVRLRRALLARPTLLYLSNVGAVAAGLLALVAQMVGREGALWELIAVIVLALVPAITVAVTLVNWIVTHTLPPHMLPKLDFRAGIPPEHRTMVVVPALLVSDADVDDLLRQLEQHYLGNSDPQLTFALLTDFTDAPLQQMPGDERLLTQAVAGIRMLNERYAGAGVGPFCLLHRARTWNPSEGCWMGWERKRGKLHELNRMLLGAPGGYAAQIAHPDALIGTRYVIAVDADTTLPRESARRLIATLAHPLNRPVLAPDHTTVVAGYSVLQPRLEIRPGSVNQSRFARVFASDSGLDLYTRAVSDVYQDLFGEGIYVGKGIYDVAAFEAALGARAPDNALLSHDLFEGIHARAGLVSDIVLFEEYPPTYLAYTRRLHRWVRGDWQLLPWLARRVPHAACDRTPSALTALDRWKILDNLRRSLFMPALLLLLIGGWAWFPGSALVWTAVSLLLSAAPFAPGAAAAWSQRLQGDEVSRLALSADVLRWLLALVFLPYEALVQLSAIGATLLRLTVTRRGLLQWHTAASTALRFGVQSGRRVFWSQMAAGPLLSAALALALALVAPASLLPAAPFLLAWLLSPEIAYYLSRPICQQATPLSEQQLAQLRQLARRTWLYFESFVGPEDHWLPPDHFQEIPRGTVAHRTSPTNIGLALLSTLAAYDLGYVGPAELVLRLGGALDGMDSLEHHRGHLLNWIETRTLASLHPRYVSTVDSGNLAGSLIALRQGCLGLLDGPPLQRQRWLGLLDTLDMLSLAVQEGGAAPPPELAASLLDVLADMRRDIVAGTGDPVAWPGLIARLGDTLIPQLDDRLIALVEGGADRLGTATLQNLRIWSERLRQHTRALRHDIDTLLPWLGLLSEAPAALTDAAAPDVAGTWQAIKEQLTPRVSIAAHGPTCASSVETLERLRKLIAAGAIAEEHRRPCQAWCDRLAHALAESGPRGEQLAAQLRELADRAGAAADDMDFRFLYDPRRQVFHIGYQVGSAALDGNYYDLLASEARIASLVAIAKGDVPQSHWVHLGRPFALVAGVRALISWSGTMFEYLMPLLLTRQGEETLLGRSCAAAIDRQIAYAQQRGVPWGISESGYYRFDTSQSYQYQAFGVPMLGLKRGLADDLVVAPYASLLALPLRPLAVVRNLERLQELRLQGRYGLYEAIDFTRERLPARQQQAVVQSYMVHHQSMILLSLDNFLRDDTMVARFHADPRIESVALLLQEQIPPRAPLEHPPGEEPPHHAAARPPDRLPPWQVPVGAPLPQVLALSNGHYTTLITSAGGGCSRWNDVDLTRWRADTTLDSWGAWIYLKDRDSGALWSAAHQPVAAPPERQEVRFFAHKAEIIRRDHGIVTHLEVAVAPRDDVEVRRITIANDGDEPRRLQITSYAEVVLGSQSADQRHQAFGKLFVESEYLADTRLLLFRRRPRSASELPAFLGHLLTGPRPGALRPCYESDRAAFVGRGGTDRAPACLRRDGIPVSGVIGTTLDPVMSLGCAIDLAPRETVRLAYVTLAAGTREAALALATTYHAWAAVDLALDQAESAAAQTARRLGQTAADLAPASAVLSALLYPHRALRADPQILAANQGGQPGLWPHAISGDYPILLVTIDSEEGCELLPGLLHAYRGWREQRLMADLIILNRTETGYDQELHAHLLRLIARADCDGWLGQHCGIFLLRAEQLAERDLVLLRSAARVILDGAQPLARQLEQLHQQRLPLPPLAPTRSLPDERDPTPALEPPDGLLYPNGYGGFSADGREYVVYLGPDRWTPAPWINVIANPGFGCLVSDAGLGTTWAANSGENRLTPWRNDPVSDEPAEAIYLRDEETGAVWSPTPLPARAPAPYLVRHGAGYSVFEHHSHGLKQRLRVFAATGDPVKVVHLRLENCWGRGRRLTVTFYAEWVLGTSRAAAQDHVVPEFDSATGAVMARNTYNVEFGERVAFVAASKTLHGMTASRTAFLGRMGSLSQPAALGRIGLDSAVEPGDDPCAAVQVHVDLPPAGVEEVFFLLGQGADRQETARLLQEYRHPERVAAAWDEVRAHWDALLGAVSVRTPDPAMDLLLNRWLLYQALACRVWGRTALYQSSGAFGFRDQLQDVMALLHARPALAREHILEAARHQFVAGDVLHWWHPPSGRGVRTRCSDDLLWLPFVTAHYLTVTGDTALLSERIPFLDGPPLAPEEEERYGHFASAGPPETIYEHCLRALERGATAGAHGLPLMGGGDWNDGMNRIGSHGRGESVWLGWFLYRALVDFAPICERAGDTERAARYRHQARVLQAALESAAWDGAWYLRAFDDDGVAVGSASSDECQIDSVAQSWAVLSGGGDPEHAARAMEAVIDRLARLDDQVLLLLAPPFDTTPRDPGYIKGYPPGVRENGGQYTHAAAWVVWALAELGWGNRATALFGLLNPIGHSDTPAHAEHYHVEPYVVAADVRGVPPHTGRGGWTWYTGSAAWMYRVGIEAILGLRREGAALRLDPCIPRAWPGYEVVYRYENATYRVIVENPDGVNRGVQHIALEDATVPSGAVPLAADGRDHVIRVRMG